MVTSQGKECVYVLRADRIDASPARKLPSKQQWKLFSIAGSRGRPMGPPRRFLPCDSGLRGQNLIFANGGVKLAGEASDRPPSVVSEPPVDAPILRTVPRSMH